MPKIKCSRCKNDSPAVSYDTLQEWGWSIFLGSKFQCLCPDCSNGKKLEVSMKDV